MQTDIIRVEKLTVGHGETGFNSVTPPTEELWKVVLGVSGIDVEAAKVAGTRVQVLRKRRRTCVLRDVE